MNVVIIPARSGSKGVPNKNIYPLWGKPLIAWSVLCAKASGIVDSIILSTDSEEYAEIGRQYGCEVPFLRSRDLAEDKSNIKDAIMDLINKTDSQRWKTLSILEPTCPLRTPEMIAKCINAVNSSAEIHSSLTLTQIDIKFHPYKQLAIDANGMVQYAHEKGKTVVNRQEITPTYIRNGACYTVKKEYFKASNNIIGENTLPVIIDSYLINIDNQSDIDNLKAYEKSHGLPSWLK